METNHSDQIETEIEQEVEVEVAAQTILNLEGK
jgi:hypothetical protein